MQNKFTKEQIEKAVRQAIANIEMEEVEYNYSKLPLIVDNSQIKVKRKIKYERRK